jgi:hypothetical protein
MNKERVLVIFLLLVTVVALYAAGVLYVAKNAEISRRLDAEAQLASIKKLKTSLEKEIEDLNNIKASLEAKVEDSQSQIQDLQLMITKEKEEKTNTQENLAKAKAEYKSLSEALELEKREKRSLLDQLLKMSQDYQVLLDQNKDLQEAKETLDEKVKELFEKQKEIELKNIVVTPPSAATYKVLVVNRDIGFFVVNIGEKENVKVGTLLEVSRNGSPIAKAKIEKIYKDFSAAVPTDGLAHFSKIAEGDAVTVSPR